MTMNNFTTLFKPPHPQPVQSTIPPPKPRGSLFSRWSTMTSFHGVNEFHTAQGLTAKFLWFMILVVGTFLAANQSTELILNYALEDKWVTTMSAESAPDGAMKWPNILICKISETELRVPDLRRRGLYDPYDVAFVDLGSDGVEFYAQMQERDPLNSTQFEKKVEERKQKFNCSQVYPFCLQDRFSCDDTVIDCGGGSGRVNPTVSCDCSKYASDSDKSDCFNINSTALLKDKPPPTPHTIGFFSGIYLLLHPRIRDIYPYLLKYDALPPAGLRVEIFFDGQVMGATSPIFMWSGSQSVIAMTAEKKRIKTRSRRTLHFNYGDDTPCIKKGVYKWYKTDVPSRQLCQSDCFAEFCAQYLNCTMDMQSARTGDEECNEEQEQNCSLARMELHGLLPSGFNVTHCEISCKEPCETEFITTKVTSTEFPAPTKVAAFQTYLNRAVLPKKNASKIFNFTKEDIDQLILLNIFYESNEFKVVEKVNRASLDEMVSSIGGILGVWTGMSMITIFQAILYAIRGLERMCRTAGQNFRNAAELR